MIPVKNLIRQTFDELLVVNLSNFVFFFLQSYLNSCVLDVDYIKASNVITFILFKNLLIRHS